MATIDLFGDCLALFLSDRGWSAADLAQSVRVDASLVRRWIRNERIPALNSGHVDEIAACLELSAAELRRLEAAQIFGLKRQQKIQQKHRAKGSEAQRLLLLAQESSPTSRVAQLPAPPGPAAQPPVAGVIKGPEHLLQAACGLIESVPAPLPGQTAAILLTSQGGDTFDDFPDLLGRWHRALSSALERRWAVHHLMRLDGDAHRSICLVESMLQLVGTTGRYQSRCFVRYGALAAPYELLVVPGTGAMLFFSTENAGRVDAALCVHEPQHIDLLAAHFAELLSQTKPLLQSYLAPEQAVFAELIAATEEKPGDRFLVQDGPSVLTQPTSWCREDSSWARGSCFSGWELSTQIQLQRRRAEAFRRQVQSYRFAEICPKRAIQRLVETGTWARDSRAAPARGTRESPAERIEHLQNVVQMLKTFPNYDLALIDESEEGSIPPIAWEVKGAHTVLMATCSPASEDEPIGLASAEPTIAGAFQSYFVDISERIAPRNRDKRDVIRWLEREIQILCQHRTVDDRRSA